MSAYQEQASLRFPCRFCGALAGHVCKVRGTDTPALAVHSDRTYQRDYSATGYAGPRAMMDVSPIVAKFDAIDHNDPEVAHDQADTLLLEAVHPDVAEAYDRVVKRCSWWASA